MLERARLRRDYNAIRIDSGRITGKKGDDNRRGALGRSLHPVAVILNTSSQTAGLETGSAAVAEPHGFYLIFTSTEIQQSHLPVWKRVRSLLSS